MCGVASFGINKRSAESSKALATQTFITPNEEQRDQNKRKTIKSSHTSINGTNLFCKHSHGYIWLKILVFNIW